MKRFIISALIFFILLSCLPEKPDYAPFDSTGPNYESPSATQIAGPQPYGITTKERVIYRFEPVNSYVNMQYRYNGITRNVSSDGKIVIDAPHFKSYMFKLFFSYNNGYESSENIYFFRIPSFPAATIYLQSSKDSVATNQELNIDLILAEMPQISDLEFTLLYNPDSLDYALSYQYDDISVGGFFAQNDNNVYGRVDANETKGEVTFKMGIGSNNGTQNVSGSGRIFRVRYYANTLKGKTRISLKPNISILNSSGQVIPVNLTDNVIKIFE